MMAMTRALSHCHVIGIGVRMRGGTVGPHHRVVVRGGRWHIVLVVSLQGGRARAHRRHCQGEGDGEGEGEGASSLSGRG